MLLEEYNITGARVTHYMDEQHINHIEIRKNNCIGFGATYQEALLDLKDKIIKRTLSETLKKISEKI